MSIFKKKKPVETLSKPSDATIEKEMLAELERVAAPDVADETTPIERPSWVPSPSRGAVEKSKLAHAPCPTCGNVTSAAVCPVDGSTL